MNYLLDSVRKRISLSSTSSVKNSRESCLISKSLEDLTYAPVEEEGGSEMVFYCKLLASENVTDKDGSELPDILEKVINSYQDVRSERRKRLNNKTMIRVNSDGLELTTDGSTEKSTFILSRIAFVSAAFSYTHCAVIICQSMSSPTNWRAHIFLFSKPKYARRFSLFLANQFDAGYEKWQSEQPPGTLNVEIELEAIRLKSKLKRGICNKSFVPDEDDEVAKLQRPNPDEDEDGDNRLDNFEHVSLSPHPPSALNSGKISVSNSANEKPITGATPPAVRKTMQIPTNVSIHQQTTPWRKPGFGGGAGWRPGEASQSVPLHLLDSNDGYNEFTNAESELCSNFKLFRFNNYESEDAANSPNTPTHDEVFRISPPADGNTSTKASSTLPASEVDCQNDNASNLEKMKAPEQIFLDYRLNDDNTCSIFERKLSESNGHHVNQDFLLEL